MVNKGIIVVGIIVLLSAVGVGVLIGLQAGDGPAPSPAVGDAGDETPTPEPDASADEQTETPTPAPTATEAPEPSVEERTPISPRKFNDQNMEEYIKQYINEERQAQGMEPLEVTGTTSDRLDDLAVDHSIGMAREGSAVHEIDGVSSADRYRSHGLYDACKYKSTSGSYIVKPDNPERNQFEAIAKTVAGQTYTVNGEERFHDSDQAIAKAIVDDWMASPVYSDRLLLPGVQRLGVGVTITNTGNVYATANVCG